MIQQTPNIQTVLNTLYDTASRFLAGDIGHDIFKKGLSNSLVHLKSLEETTAISNSTTFKELHKAIESIVESNEEKDGEEVRELRFYIERAAILLDCAQAIENGKILSPILNPDIEFHDFSKIKKLKDEFGVISKNVKNVRALLEEKDRLQKWSKDADAFLKAALHEEDERPHPILIRLQEILGGTKELIENIQTAEYQQFQTIWKEVVNFAEKAEIIAMKTEVGDLPLPDLGDLRQLRKEYLDGLLLNWIDNLDKDEPSQVLFKVSELKKIPQFPYSVTTSIKHAMQLMYLSESTEIAEIKKILDEMRNELVPPRFLSGRSSQQTLKEGVEALLDTSKLSISNERVYYDRVLKLQELVKILKGENGGRFQKILEQAEEAVAATDDRQAFDRLYSNIASSTPELTEEANLTLFLLLQEIQKDAPEVQESEVQPEVQAPVAPADSESTIVKVLTPLFGCTTLTTPVAIAFASPEILVALILASVILGCLLCLCCFAELEETPTVNAATSMR